MRVDVHAHYFPWAYVERINALNPELSAMLGAQRKWGAGADRDELEARLAAMDEAGVDMQVLSVASNFPYVDDESRAVDLARQANDLFAEVAARYPTRLAAFAVLPLPHVDAALAEMERAFDDHHMVGIAMGASVMGRPACAPEFDPVYEEANRRGTAMFGHAMQCALYSPLLEGFPGLDACGAAFENTSFAMHMVDRRIPLRFPDLKIIVSHLGGALPAMFGRLDDAQLKRSARIADLAEAPEPPSATLRRMWYDSMTSYDPVALRAGCERFGADRIVLGTDFPWKDYSRCVRYVEEAGLPREDVDRILDQNAARILGLS